jgi:excisionase family DNA binding protein
VNNHPNEIRIDNVSIIVHVEGKPLYLTVAQAAAEVGYHESYIRSMIREGHLPSYKGDGSSGRVRIRTSDLLAFMELRKVAP